MNNWYTGQKIRDSKVCKWYIDVPNKAALKQEDMLSHQKKVVDKAQCQSPQHMHFLK